MPPTYHTRLTLRRPAPSFAQCPASPDLKSASTLMPNNDFFQEFMWSCIERVRDQTLAALVAPATKAKDNTNRSLKPWNLDLYYSHLHMEYYYFCLQCKDHFKFIGSLGQKRVPFAIGFLRDCILN